MQLKLIILIPLNKQVSEQWKHMILCIIKHANPERSEGFLLNTTSWENYTPAEMIGCISSLLVIQNTHDLIKHASINPVIQVVILSDSASPTWQKCWPRFLCFFPPIMQFADRRWVRVRVRARLRSYKRLCLITQLTPKMPSDVKLLPEYPFS